MSTLTLKIISTQHEEKRSFLLQNIVATYMILCTVKVLTIIDFPRSHIIDTFFFRISSMEIWEYGNS